MILELDGFCTVHRSCIHGSSGSNGRDKERDLLTNEKEEAVGPDRMRYCYFRSHKREQVLSVTSFSGYMLRKITGPFREFGFLAGLLYAIGRLLSRLSPALRLYVYELMVQPITSAALLSDRLQKQLEVREIKPADPEMALMPVRP